MDQAVRKDGNELPKFWRSLKGIEYEIANQIHFAELAFTICQKIPIDPGRGNDLLPYFYNLNFNKGIIALHSLLSPTNDEEISLYYYMRQYNWEFKKHIDGRFRKEVNKLKKRYEETINLPIRNKVAAHTDVLFDHTSFTSAYILPKTIPGLIKLTTDLKSLFFKISNYSINDDPMAKIKEQVDRLIETLQ
jgi:hypothetical protein